MKNKVLDDYLEKHYLPPFGVIFKQRNKEISINFSKQSDDFKIERWIEYLNAENPPEMWKFMQSNTYGIETLSLKGAILNKVVLDTLKSAHWTKNRMAR